MVVVETGGVVDNAVVPCSENFEDFMIYAAVLSVGVDSVDDVREGGARVTFESVSFSLCV